MYKQASIPLKWSIPMEIHIMCFICPFKKCSFSSLLHPRNGEMATVNITKQSQHELPAHIQETIYYFKCFICKPLSILNILHHLLSKITFTWWVYFFAETTKFNVQGVENLEHICRLFSISSILLQAIV